MFYEYQCTDRKCRHITELMRSVSARLDPAFCERCNSEAFKIISIPQRSYGLKFEVDNYPMVNPFLSKRGEPPVVFENKNERKAYYKKHGLVDAVTPESDKRTMYTSDGDVENYKDFDKYSDVEQQSRYVRAQDNWEKNPNE